MKKAGPRRAPLKGRPDAVAGLIRLPVVSRYQAAVRRLPPKDLPLNDFPPAGLPP